MRKIVVFMNVTLDGVCQGPGGKEEDRRGGFELGGWAAPYADAVSMQAAGESMATTDALLLGRRTYEDFHGYWPHQKDNPFTEVLNNRQKYVASTTLREPLPWMNSTLLKGDVAEAVAALKEQPGKDIVVLGSWTLVQTLMRHKLIDQWLLQIHPLILGTGMKLFPDGAPYAELRLVDSRSSTTGVLIATYQPAGAEA